MAEPKPSARARLGHARRGMIRRKQKVGIVSGITEDIGAIGAFIGGKIKESKTAWDEYQTGYKKKFPDQEYTPEKRGWFSKPKGEVTVGDQIYQRKDIQKLGAFYESDIGKILDDRGSSYMETIAPGKPIPGPVSTTPVTPQNVQQSNMGTGQQLGGLSDIKTIEPGPQMRQSLGQKLTSGVKSLLQDFGTELKSYSERYKVQDEQPGIGFQYQKRNFWDSQIQNNRNRIEEDLY